MRAADVSRRYWAFQASGRVRLAEQFADLGMRDERDACLRAALKIIAVHGPVGLRHEAREISEVLK